MPLASLPSRKYEGLREIVLNRVAVAAVVERAKLRQKILRLGVLGLVFKVVVVDGFGAAQIVDADHERAKVLERADGSQVDEREGHTNEGKKGERNLEIGVGHHGITVLFEVEPLGVVESGIVVHHITLSRTCGGRFQNAGGRAAGGAAEDVVGKGGDFQEDVDRREKRNEEDGKPGDELDGRKRAGGREIERAENEISDDKHDGCGDDLVEGILDEAAEPAPEEPFQLRNDEEWNEDGTDQHAHRGGDESVGDDNNRDGLRGGEQDGDDDVDRVPRKSPQPGESMRDSKSATCATTVWSWA